MGRRTVKYSWFFLMGSLLFSQSMINRLKVPLIMKGNMGFGYDNNYLRLSDKEIHEDDSVEVQPDFELIAFDFVSNPSTQGAFMHPLSEGVNKSKTRTCGKWCKIESIINSIMRGE